MRIPSDIQVPVTPPRSGVLEALGLRVGEVFTARVVGQTPGQGVQVQINGQTINLNLPLEPQLGQLLRFEFQSGGQRPQLALLTDGQQQGGKPPPQAQQVQTAQIAPVAARPTTPIPAPQSANPLPQTPVTIEAQIFTQQPSAPASTPQVATANPAPQAQPNSPAPAGSPVSSGTPAPTPQAQPQNIQIPIPAAVRNAIALQPGQSVTVQITPPPASGIPSTITVAGQTIAAALPSGLPTSVPVTAQVQATADGLQLVLPRPTPTPGQPTPQPQGSQTHSAPPAQPTASRATPLPYASPAPSVAPQQLVAQALPNAAIARQDSVGTLLASITGFSQTRQAEFPAPVANAVRRLAASPLRLDTTSPDPRILQQAIVQSGIFSENLLATGRTANAQGDLKSLLLLLRGTLTNWLGEDGAPLPQHGNRPPPPVRGGHPRAQGGEPQLPPDPGSAREAGRQLLSQTDSALSRIRLFQLASLPEAHARGNPASAAEWNMELPVTLGQESAIAQFQISRDGTQGDNPAERGWHMAFSVNFKVTGEIGAKVSLRAKKTSVMLWAAEEETAETLEEMLPELVSGLEAHGLEPGAIRVRIGTPDNRPSVSGGFVDAVS